MSIWSRRKWWPPINTYFSALTDGWRTGTVDKFEGDAIVALFGAPVEDPHTAQEACLTALALQMKMKELNVQTGKELAIRVGIATGEAIVEYGPLKPF